MDFWTYSCINCVRTLPYITAWDAKYRDKGLVIVGVHSPEFEFEKNLPNVVAGDRAKYGIKYPVALDSKILRPGAISRIAIGPHIISSIKTAAWFTRISAKANMMSPKTPFGTCLGLGPQ